jgi:hypothetical protein
VKPIAVVVLLVFALLVGGGIFVTFLARAREASMLAGCQNNLRVLAGNCATFKDGFGRLPAGTVFNKDLEPSHRLGLFVNGWPIPGPGKSSLLLDTKLAWDALENRQPQMEVQIAPKKWETRAIVQCKPLQCPANPRTTDPQSGIGCTSYVGIAGLGRDTAAYPRTHPGAGAFGYDPSVPVQESGPSLGILQSDMKRGLSPTMLFAETATQSGPWTAGGFPSVRGLDPDGGAYLGPSGQFSSSHHSNGKPVTMFGFADGAARTFVEGTDRAVLESLAALSAPMVIEKGK